MKKTLIFLTIFIFSFSVALAQDQATSSATSTATSTKLLKLEQRNEKIRNYTAQMQQKLNVIVGNLERTALRVETQINKLASSTATSTDFSAARAKLADAKKKIEELKTGIAGLSQKAEEVIASKTPKTVFYNVREKLVKAFVSKIKVIHKELLDSVKLAKKEIVKINSQNVTSTQDVSDWKTYRNEKFGFEIKYPEFLQPGELLSSEVKSIEDIKNPKSPTNLDVGFVQADSKTEELGICFKVVATLPFQNNSAPNIRVKKFPSAVWGQWEPSPKEGIFINGYRAMRSERVNTTPDYLAWGGCPPKFHESIYNVWDTNIYLLFRDSRCGVCSNVDFNKVLSTFKLLK